MSALLDDIINLATEGNQPLSDTLRKCLVLGHDLKNERLKLWAQKELNGYQDTEVVPDYRTLDAPAKGNFIGPFYAQYPARLIAPYTLEESHRIFASKVRLPQAIRVLEDAVAKAKGHLTFPWPGDLVARYEQEIIGGGFALQSAWQEVSTPMLSGVLDTVRNQTLEMALAIKDELGTSYETLRNLEPATAERIQSIVFNNTGGITNVALERGQIDASGQMHIVAGDRKELDDLLKKAGLADNDLQELTQAMAEDGGQQPGEKVQGWIKSTASKVLVGGVKVGVSIGQQILTAWLMQHYGLSN